MTERQRRAYDFIQRHWADHGYGPSYEVLALSVGIPGRSGAHRLVASMIAAGMLERGPGKRRNVRVVEPPIEAAILKSALREIAATDRHQDAVRIAQKALGA